MDVDAEEDIPCPGTDVIGLVGVEDVTLVIVDKLASETLGGNGGKEVVTTTTSADVLDGDDVVGLGVWSSTLPSSIFMFLRFLSISLTPNMVTGGKRQRIS